MKRFVPYLTKIFLLYTLRNPEKANLGLGYLGSRSDQLHIHLHLGKTSETGSKGQGNPQKEVSVVLFQNVGAGGSPRRLHYARRRGIQEVLLGTQAYCLQSIASLRCSHVLIP